MQLLNFLEMTLFPRSLPARQVVLDGPSPSAKKPGEDRTATGSASDPARGDKARQRMREYAARGVCYEVAPREQDSHTIHKARQAGSSMVGGRLAHLELTAGCAARQSACGAAVGACQPVVQAAQPIWSSPSAPALLFPPCSVDPDVVMIVEQDSDLVIALARLFALYGREIMQVMRRPDENG